MDPAMIQDMDSEMIQEMDSEMIQETPYIAAMNFASSETSCWLHIPLLCCDNDHAIFWGHNLDTHSVREKVDNTTPFHCCIPSSLSICNNAISSVRLIYGLYIQHSQENQESSKTVSCPLPTVGENARS